MKTAAIRHTLLLLLILSFSSCATYDKVAVWYKYRRDFHLPKTADNAIKPSEDGKNILQQNPNKKDVYLADNQKNTLLATCSPEAKASSRINAINSPSDKGYAKPKFTNHVVTKSKSLARQYRILKPRHNAQGEPRTTHWATTTGAIFAAGVLALFVLAIIVGSTVADGWTALGYVVLLLLLSILSAILGLIFSIIGISQTSQYPEKYKNYGLALASIILTSLVIVSVVIGFLI